MGFAGMTIKFESVEFPTDLTNHRSFVGHPATKELLEALGAITDTSGIEGKPGKYAGPMVGDFYLSVPLCNNPRDGKPDQIISSVSSLKCIKCTRME
jgi:hypothetical protein